MTHLLDTNVCITHLRSGGTGPIATRLQALHPTDAVLCSVVVTELIYGALRSRKQAKNLAEVQSFVAGFRSLPFDDPAAFKLAEVRAHLAAQGLPIGPFDMIIASIALANNLTVVTHNTGEFSRVPGLKLEDWQTP